MFSFHKPKIYRSNLGCCICKAKSSSSRFTDSKKYENEFERCFRIQEKRSGEICNACVLLVKRWKKLSPENRLSKHWHHVVDARAGPGTKLTGNRRLPGPSSSGAGSSMSSSSSSSASSLRHDDERTAGPRQRKSEVLPLSSSQSSNQSNSTCGASTSAGKRSSSFSKVCAIDTNVSTFTFGEPQRRNYMTLDTTYSTSSISSSSSSLSKPQSALNSSAFESVIKRFRQRQQQQQLEAQRRLLNRQQRQLQRQQQTAAARTSDEDKKGDQTNGNRQQLSSQNSSESASDVRPQLAGASSDSSQQAASKPSAPVLQPAMKRQKRSSESIGSLAVDGCRISTWLDPTLWRKEKICCGIIFHGLYNEVVVFPKLLKPCQCRLSGHQKPAGAASAGTPGEQARERRSVSPQPPPRTTKSGSISSCDSNTSGTGSMEQPIDENAKRDEEGGALAAPARYLRRKARSQAHGKLSGDEESAGASGSSGKRTSGAATARPVSIPMTRRKRKLCDTDSNLSSSSSSNKSANSDNSANQTANSPSSSSGASSTRLLLSADDEDDVEAAGDAHLMDTEDDVDPESSTDGASSSVDSIGAELEGKQQQKGESALGAMG